MTKRRSKKKKSGSHGHGSSKKNRNAGNRGGRGNAGRGKKAKHDKMTEDGIHQLGEKGFNTENEQTGINLKDIDQAIETFVEEDKAEKTDSGYTFYADKAGYDKILGKGQLRKNIDVHASKFSETARQKIEDSENKAIET
ncbi:MAG: uL15m family ribosomal protein [Candidatus Nanohaloarchaea archaeon]